jgi:transposase
MKSTTSDPTNRRWTVYLPADLLERLRQSATLHRRSLNSELVWALDQYAQAEKRKRKRDADQESVSVSPVSDAQAGANPALCAAPLPSPLQQCVGGAQGAFYQMRRKSLGYTSQAAELAEIKAAYPAYQDISSQVLQDVLRRLDKAFGAFFRRIRNGEKPGYPRFQGQGRYDSFTYPQSGFALAGNILTLSKIGESPSALASSDARPGENRYDQAGCESLVRHLRVRGGRRSVAAL